MVANARVIDLEENTAIVHGDVVLAARLGAKSVAALPGLADLQTLRDDSCKSYEHLWDLVDGCADAMRMDFTLLAGKGHAPVGVTIIGEPGQVYIENDTRIDPFVCIDATN
jgi:hypothetical protein